MTAQEEVIDIREAVSLGAISPEFYCRFFFPKTFRQKSPGFHRLVWQALEDESNRYVAEMIFRDGAKTTTCRTFVSKRIAYGISRTILFIGKGEDSAHKSLEWIYKQVMFNKLWADTFQLRPGTKWAPGSGEIEILHATNEHPIRLLAMGISGQTRGINIDDYRPDLIVVDDPCDEQNTATVEQRKKMSDLFFGSLYNSLAPRSENPDAKLVLLQTLLNGEDLISQCEKDSNFKTLRFSCFDEGGNSRWEDRHPTKELVAKKQGYIDRNQLSLWLREYECQLISSETSSFDLDWLQYWDVLPEGMTTFMAIDPVPPPSEIQIAKGLNDKDFEVLAVVGIYKGKYYLCDYSMNRGHSPDWTIAEFFRLLDKWKPLRVRVETVNYQRTLKWLLEKEMHKRRRYVQINSDNGDRRGKNYRIIDALNGIAANKNLFVSNKQAEFIQQFGAHPHLSHDDVIECVAMAVTEAHTGYALDGDYSVIDESDIPALPQWRACS